MPPLRRLLAHVLEFAYPGACAACRSPCDGAAFLCLECERRLDDLAEAPACKFCAMPLATHGAPCPYCHGKGIPHFDRIIRLGIYEDPIKSIIHQLKYHRRWPLGEHLADRLLATERAKGILTETEVLVPVPLHFRRHVERGYNQADVIARRLQYHCGISVVHAVRRTRHTETQTNLHSHDQRRDNVHNAFAVRRPASRIRGKHVLLIDDVMTTGETLKSVARLLKSAEPASLCAMVIGLADPKGRGFEVI